MPGSSRQRGFRVDGDMLRRLRLACGWSQEEAAHRAGVSDRLIRKAEAGRPVDAKILVALSDLYSTSQQILAPADLIAKQESDAAQPTSILVNWITDAWQGQSFESLQSATTATVVFHCELGTLQGTRAVWSRFEAIRRSFDGFNVEVERSFHVADKTICRWRLSMIHSGSWQGLEPTSREITTMVTTSARINAGKIHECWEFWQSQPIYRELSRRIEC